MFVQPYGDTAGDGAVQLSFTLPVRQGAQAIEAARQLVLKLGFHDCQIVHAAPLDDEFTFFVAYAKTAVAIDLDKVHVEELADEPMTFEEVNTFIREQIGRKLVVVGACTGSDAHTVGIDAIMNMKGCNHHYGLERYPMVEAHNLGAQVTNERLIARARELDADAILVSQVVTQKDTHVHNLTQFVELLEAERLRDRFILVVGGPRISHRIAMEIGFDAGFGPGTYAEHVASFIARRMVAGSGG
ncbi:MAG: cobalamin-dependent protein [Phycisphaerae bacterium]|nr:cobalamin-dependent protein [Phycisphaerae bacterium]